MNPADVISLRPRPINPHGAPNATTASVAAAAIRPQRKPDEALVRKKASSAATRKHAPSQKNSPHARIAEHQMQQAVHPAIKRLKVKLPRAAFEPVPLHDDAVAKALVHPEIVARRVPQEAADVSGVRRNDQREPGDADEHERAEHVLEARRHRHQGRSGQSRHAPLRKRHTIRRGEPAGVQPTRDHIRRSRPAKRCAPPSKRSTPAPIPERVP